MIFMSDRSVFPATPGVYVMHFPNGKKYVGMTVRSIRTRLLHHSSAALAGRHSMPVRAALAKYGLDAVSVTFPDGSGQPSQDERALIAKMADDGVALYNMTVGGDGISGFSHKPDVRASMSASAKKSWTPERRQKASATLRSPEVRKRLIAAQRRSWDDDRRARMANHVRERSAKLSDVSVLEIAESLKSGESCVALGKRFGVTPEAISAIKHGKNWSHVTGIKRSA